MNKKTYYRLNRRYFLAKAKEYRDKNKDVINDKQLRAYYRNKSSACINGYNGKNPERLLTNIIKEDKMDFYVHQTKREKLNWIHWFYNGLYSKYEIRQVDYVGWYYRLRYGGAVKNTSLLKKKTLDTRTLV